MRALIAGFCLFSGNLMAEAIPVRNSSPPINLLTSGETAGGWLLLFDGMTTFGWKATGPVKVAAEGNLVLGGEKVGRIDCTSSFGDCELAFEFRGAEGNIHVRRQNSGASAQNSTLFRSTNLEAWEKATLKIEKNLVWFRMAQAADFKKIPGSSTIGFSSRPGRELHLRNIKLKPLGLKSIFNGKDLTGWKEFPGKKSRFTVKDKGELNVQNGPGDLQTVGKYGDFVLQLECISNGKHLNSGVFFRCRPGEYQNGYEAQIRNQFTPEPKQVYTIEEFDPRTHKLVAKNKVTMRAVDYGTGAIYRRQPARLQASKDGEWFTLTVLAHGNHFATWVNGIQVTDWTDNRPPSDNARTGFRLAPGHISLQGHDPTTNLSFRNFRVAELPRP